MGDQQKDQSIQKPQTPPGVSKEAKKPDLTQKPEIDDKELDDADTESSDLSGIDKKKPQ